MDDRVEEVEVGTPVVFCDSTGNDHNALITANWGHGCVNLLHVSSDKEKQDSYGRQIERVTSLNHVSDSDVHGFYWRFADEEPNPYKPPKKV